MKGDSVRKVEMFWGTRAGGGKKLEGRGSKVCHQVIPGGLTGGSLDLGKHVKGKAKRAFVIRENGERGKNGRSFLAKTRWNGSG